jgi:hypothetical protein
LSGSTEENHKTLPGQPVSGFESGTVQIMAANRATATAGYYIIIPIIVVVVITELFLNGPGAMKVHTKTVSANNRTQQMRTLINFMTREPTAAL